MNRHQLSLTGADGPMPADEVVPENTARAAVIVVQEAFGVNSHIIDVCTRFAADGYLAIAPQLYHRAGVNALPYDIACVTPVMDTLTAEGIRSDLNATIEHLATQGFSAATIGVVGFCMGGTVSFVAAAERALGAAVTFYGSGLTQGRFGFAPLIELAPSLRTPWLGLYGDLDGGIPAADVETLRGAAASAPVPTAIVRYADAGHAFHCDARPDKYHEAAARDGWTKTLDWFGRYLTPAS
jgi:carboxymethylenebutenolidase